MVFTGHGQDFVEPQMRAGYSKIVIYWVDCSL